MGRVKASAILGQGRVVCLMYATPWSAVDVAATVARRHAVHQARRLMCVSPHMSSEWLDVHDERMNSGTQARLLRLVSLSVLWRWMWASREALVTV